MAEEMTVGRMMVRRALPPELRHELGELNGEGIKSLFQKIADKYPEQYPDITKKLLKIGADVSYGSGGYSFGLDDLTPSPRMRAIRAEIKNRVRGIYGDKTLDGPGRNQKVMDYLSSLRGDLETTTFDEMKKTNNPLVMQVASGSRGKRSDLLSLLMGDLSYDDNSGKPIPFPILRSFSEGLSPAEAFAESFGARAGVLAVKNATGDAGYFAKKLNRAAHRRMVMADDSDDPEYTNRGMPVDVDDNDNIGALLAHPVAGYKRNTEITPAVLKDLRQRGVDKMLVRSPILGGTEDGGVYAKDVGIWPETGRLASIGTMAGLLSSQAVSEPVTQGSLGKKHSGGVSGAATGFDAVDLFVDAPSESPSWATHSGLDGVVTSVRPHPAGGTIVNVDGEEHYAYPGAEITVKPGDKVEAGDTLTNGIPNPNEFVKHKGIGEGRRIYTEAMRKLLKDGGFPAPRRHLELIAGGLANHVRMTDEHADWLPNDVVSYDKLAKNWRTREGATQGDPSRAIGQYLEKPSLHYTLGTRVTPRVAKDLAAWNVKSVTTHKDPMPFEPEYVSATNTLAYDDDWQTRMAGSYLQKSTLDAARRGLESDPLGSSFVPALAEGTNFGLRGRTQPAPTGLR